jgi:hypothetical protein
VVDFESDSVKYIEISTDNSYDFQRHICSFYLFHCDVLCYVAFEGYLDFTIFRNMCAVNLAISGT